MDATVARCLRQRGYIKRRSHVDGQHDDSSKSHPRCPGVATFIRVAFGTFAASQHLISATGYVCATQSGKKAMDSDLHVRPSPLSSSVFSLDEAYLPAARIKYRNIIFNSGRHEIQT